MLVLGLTLIMSCSKDPIDETTNLPGEFDPEVVECDMELLIQQEYVDSTLVLSAILTGGTAPFIYSWSSGETDELISVTESGEYSLGITDAEGCIVGETILVDLGGGDCNDFSLFLSVDTMSLELAANVSGGTPPYNYLWSTDEYTSSISISTPGDYAISVIDSEGCVLSEIYSSGGNVDCSNFNGQLFYDEFTDSLVPNIVGGTEPFNYEWSNGSTDESIIVTDDGLYSVIVTDANGCAFYAEYNLDTNPCNNFEAYFLQDTVSNQLIAMPFGGTAPYAYLWSTGESTESITVTENGEITLTVIDADGCTVTYSQFVFNWEDCDSFMLEFLYNENAETLSGEATGGIPPYTYLWNTGETTETISVVDTIHTLEIVDAIGCLVVGAFHIP